MDIEFKLTTEANAQARLVQSSRLVSSPRAGMAPLTLNPSSPGGKRLLWRRVRRGMLPRRIARVGAGRPAGGSSVRSRCAESRRRRAVSVPPAGASCSSDDCGGPSSRRLAATVRHTAFCQLAGSVLQRRPAWFAACSALATSKQPASKPGLPCGSGRFMHALYVVPEYAKRCCCLPCRQPHNRQPRLARPELRRQPA